MITIADVVEFARTTPRDFNNLTAALLWNMVAEDQEPVYPTARAAFFGSTIVSTDPLLAIAGDVHWASNSSHWDVALQVNDTLVFVPDPRTTFVSTMTLADWVTRAERHGQYQGWSHAYGTHQPVAHFHGSFDA